MCIDGSKRLSKVNAAVFSVTRGPAGSGFFFLASRLMVLISQLILRAAPGSRLVAVFL